MKRILSVMLAVVMVLGVMCSFSFAAEATTEEVESVNSARALATPCPYCESYNVQAGTTARSILYTSHISCEHHTY
ncbi:MAG: hypothetical protein LUH56_06365 [Oscillospiraceae bacterium]|nr:hypothetical protein [Oscillospiraceae bacterium]